MRSTTWQSVRQQKSLVYSSLDDFHDTVRIGEGAFADVYRGTDRTGQLVALKRINLSIISDKNILQTTKNEIELYKSLKHHNIVECFGSFEVPQGNLLVLVLEYINGGDLEMWLQEKVRPLRSLVLESTIWSMFHQIAAGVNYIHSQKIIHRDLKPANVLLNNNGLVKLTDFGLSRLTQNNSGVKTVCGTPYYMAPERIAEDSYSFTSDIWSLGCILYEMAALRSPFFGEKDNVTSLIAKIKTADYPPLPEDCYSLQLTTLMDAMLNPTPSKRPSAKDIHRVALGMHQKWERCAKQL